MRTTNTARTARTGFTLLELIIVVLLIGVLAAVGVPRLRPSPALQVHSSAAQIAHDLEQARTRAMTTRRPARVTFDVAGQQYTGFLADSGTTMFGETEGEMRNLRGFGRRELDGGVEFGRSGAPPLPNDPGIDVVTLPDSRVEFNSRGTTIPFGTRGTIYLQHPRDPSAVAAVSITGAGTFRTWRYLNGAWE